MDPTTIKKPAALNFTLNKDDTNVLLKRLADDMKLVTTMEKMALAIVRAEEIRFETLKQLSK